MTNSAEEKTRCGILAFGSLIWEPGQLEKLRKIDEREYETPWPVEFAHSSTYRGGAPTLVRVTHGKKVMGRLYLYSNDAQEVIQALADRERTKLDKIGSFTHLGIPIYFADLSLNITPLTPNQLAKLTIESVKKCPGRNGILYLRKCIEHGINTELTPEYTAAILRETKTKNLNEAELCSVN